MPYVELTVSGEIDALYLKPGNNRPFLPLTDDRVLRFLHASDPELSSALLNATDDHSVLLSSLLNLLPQSEALTGSGNTAEHKSLDAIIDTVESSPADALLSLTQSDRNTVRVIEDVIDVLITLDVISFEDLPDSAQHLLNVRRALRAYMADDDISIINSNDMVMLPDSFPPKHD